MSKSTIRAGRRTRHQSSAGQSSRDPIDLTHDDTVPPEVKDEDAKVNAFRDGSDDSDSSIEEVKVGSGKGKSWKSLPEWNEQEQKAMDAGLRTEADDAILTDHDAARQELEQLEEAMKGELEKFLTTVKSDALPRGNHDWYLLIGSFKSLEDSYATASNELFDKLNAAYTKATDSRLSEGGLSKLTRAHQKWIAKRDDPNQKVARRIARVRAIAEKSNFVGIWDATEEEIAREMGHRREFSLANFN